MPVQAILFDADGVLQKPSAEFWTALSAVVGDDQRDAFLEDVFAAELTTLTGEADFAELLAPVLSKWGRAGAVQQTINAWTHIEVDAAQIDLIGSLRAAGTICALATNQQAYRARHMSETLGYREVFDHEFYSCHLGVRKPDPAYFRKILERLALAADAVLFIDDHESNVAAALSVGLHAEVFDGSASLSSVVGRYVLSGR